MKLIPMGDYYVWYCDWCDSRNLTLWTQVEKDHVYCGACHKHFSMISDEQEDVSENIMASMI